MPAGPLIAALGLIALLVASGGGKKAGAATPPTKPLDPGLPADVDAKFKQALATITDPAVLDQLAAAADTSGFSNTAAALRARAAQLRGQISIPGVPVPSAPPAPQPTLPPAIPGFPAFPGFPAIPGITPPTPTAAPAAPPPSLQPPPPPPIENLDPNIPPALAASVATLLAKADWTDQELQTADALANTLETIGFPIAAAKLRAKAIAVRAMHAGVGLLGQISTILTTPGAQLPPIPTTPLPSTPPIVAAPPVARPSGAPPAAPLAKTYKVIAGDSPAKIAQKFTGNQQNFRQLAAANPDKSARILAGTIYTGEVLTLPDAWPAQPGFATPAAGPPAPAPLAGLHATISQGSTGPDVVLWQKILGITADGVFGPNTAISTKTWQTEHGLPADGVVGPMTWAAVAGAGIAAAIPGVAAAIPGVVSPPVGIPGITIPAVATAPATTVHAMISKGSSGPDVVLWQKIVGVATDGQFGPGTEAATKTWQSQHGVLADGVVGSKTWAKALGAGAVSAGIGPGYTVQPNDTPFTIARAFTGDGSRMFELAEANPAIAAQIRNGILFQGQQLNLPITWHAATRAPSGAASAFAGVLEIIGAANAPNAAQRHNWGA